MPRTANIRAVGELAASRHGVFTLSQAVQNDLTRHDLDRLVRDEAIRRIRPGTWAFTSYEPTWRQQLCAATLGTQALAADFSAATLFGLDGLVPPTRPQVIIPRGSRVVTPALDVRETKAWPGVNAVVIDGIRCTTLARTICDVAAICSDEQLIRAADDFQRRGANLRWLMQEATALRSKGRSGPSRVLDVVSRRLHGYRVPDSWFERLIQECLRSPSIGEVVRQYVLCDAQGVFIARLDLAVPRVRLGIEAHSRSFHLGELVEAYDEDRDGRAAEQGWEISYQGFSATQTPAAVCRRIERIVARRELDLDLGSRRRAS